MLSMFLLFEIILYHCTIINKLSIYLHTCSGFELERIWTGCWNTTRINFTFSWLFYG